MKIFRRLLAIVAILIVCAGGIILEYMARGGAFRDIAPHGTDNCRAMTLSGSAEDIQIDHDRGFAYLSVLDRRAMGSDDTMNGEILRLDLNAEPPVTSPAIVDMPGQFRPHGLSLFVDTDGSRYLHVINHPVDRETQPEAVEIFVESGPGRFTHLRTLRDATMNRPNDLVAVGPEQFYVANDSGARSGWQRMREMLYGTAYATVVYFDGTSFHEAATNVATGSGINASPDGEKIYVAETTAQRLAIFARDPQTGSLKRTASAELDSAPDNIDVTPDGVLHVAAHANVVGLIRSFADPESKAPSQVLRVNAGDNENLTVEEILFDDGSMLSAGSVGAAWENGLLVGSIMDRKTLWWTTGESGGS
jgi:arylesterase/paraoxonase